MLLLTKLQRKLGEQDVLVAPPIILLGEQLLPPAPQVPVPDQTTRIIGLHFTADSMGLFSFRFFR